MMFALYVCSFMVPQSNAEQCRREIKGMAVIMAHASVDSKQSDGRNKLLKRVWDNSL